MFQHVSVCVSFISPSRWRLASEQLESLLALPEDHHMGNYAARWSETRLVMNSASRNSSILLPLKIFCMKAIAFDPHLAEDHTKLGEAF